MRRARSPGCPSRSETVTGRYLHNVHTPPVEKQCNESYSGQDDAGNVCCMHVDEVLVNNYTMAKYMKAQKGYTSGMFGKLRLGLLRIAYHYSQICCCINIFRLASSIRSRFFNLT